MKTAGSGVGRPSRDRGRADAGSRRRPPPRRSPGGRCRPGVNGSASDMVGVWMPPVIAQLMMTFCRRSASPCLAVLRLVGTAGVLVARPDGGAERARCRSARRTYAPEARRRLQHDDDRHDAEDHQVDRAEVGQRLAQQEEDDRADDRPLDRADAADHHDEDDVGGPVVDAEGGVRRDAELLQEDERADHRRWRRRRRHRRRAWCARCRCRGSRRRSRCRGSR